MSPPLAEALSMQLLAEDLPVRWQHVQGVAERAHIAAAALPDSDLLLSACWLHDIGYSPSLVETGFHPLDGARAAMTLQIGEDLSGLIANHSAAAHEARVLGLEKELERFPDSRGIIRDLLWYFDMTTSPHGESVSFDDRMAEVRERYPAGHYVSRALDVSMANRRGAVDRAESWLSSVGLTGQV